MTRVILARGPRTFAAIVVLAATVGAQPSVTRAAQPFDGAWQTTVSCPNANEALSYSYDFVSQVKEGVLHGQRGTEGKPGWLAIDGAVKPDGTADILATGVVGNSAYAQGNAPAGSAYSYKVSALFEGASGAGDRMDGRVCHYTFTKK
ncbi:MAG: hypothetical protein U1F33_11720 [Alphaproteobacteria bacterium]